MINLY